MSKSFLIVILVIEMVAAFLVGQGGCILRVSQVKAYREMRENPSEATKAEWARQLKIDRAYKVAASGVLFLAMEGPTGLIYWAGMR